MCFNERTCWIHLFAVIPWLSSPSNTHPIMSLHKIQQKYANETTTHGPLHFTGDRPVYIKIVWFAFLISLSYCSVKVHGTYWKFVSRDYTTTIKANALIFEFPDIYVCNPKPISGSYSATLSNEDKEVLRRYRKRVKESLNKNIFADENTKTTTYAMRLINTLPYQFLADKMANQINQTIIEQYFNGESAEKMIPFYSYSFLNCLVYDFSKDDIQALQSPNNYIQTAFFLDPQLPAPFDNSDKDIVSYNHHVFDLKPHFWDKNFGTDFSRSSGLRLIMTPRGQYPSEEMSTTLMIGSGAIHQIGIKMQDVVYDKDDIPCEESDDAGGADFVNPYSGKKQTFKYSHAVCWYREVARIFKEKFNCYVWLHALPWEHRSLPSCFNLTALLGKTLLASSEDIFQQTHEVYQQATKICTGKPPCRDRIYTVEYSSGRWPSEYDWDNYYRGSVSQKIANGKDYLRMPGLQYLVQNASFLQVKDSLLQIFLVAKEHKSQEVQLSLAYKFDSLIADVGGLLGLFLGMSLLSVLELVELLHDCVLTAWQRIGRRTRKTGDSNERQSVEA